MMRRNLSKVIQRYHSNDIVRRKWEHIELLSSSASKINGYWMNRLKRVSKLVTNSVIIQLNSENEIGFVPTTGFPKKGTLLDFVLQQKILYPEKIILVRVGEVSKHTFLS
jgi:hypothetical protein